MAFRLEAGPELIKGIGDVLEEDQARTPCLYATPSIEPRKASRRTPKLVLNLRLALMSPAASVTAIFPLFSYLNSLHNTLPAAFPAALLLSCWPWLLVPC